MKVRDFLEGLQKGTIVTGTGGQLSAEDAAGFVSETVDQSEFMQKMSVRRGIVSGTANMDTIALAARVMRKAVEATAPGATVAPTISRRVLSTVEVILPYDVSDSFLEENIEGENVQSTLNTLFATGFGNDLLDLSIIGDEDSGDDFIKINDGYLDIAEVDASVHDYDTNGSTDFKGTVFPGMLALMPNKWKANRKALAFIVSPATLDDYLDEIATRATAAGDAALLDAANARFKGIPVVAHPYMPDAKHILTNPKNLWIAFGRDFTYELQRQSRKRLTEYTITAKIDFEYAISDLMVLGEDFA